MKLKIFFGASATLVALVLLAGSAWAVNTPKKGTNYVKVDSCRQVGADIMVKRFGNANEYRLTSETRDAGHGLRTYTVVCVSNKKYRVDWVEASSVVQDRENPTADVTSMKYRGVENNSYLYEMKVVGRDATSGITKIKVRASGGSFLNNKDIFEWSDNNSTDKTVEKTFTTPKLEYGVRYYFIVEVWDASGRMGSLMTDGYVASVNDTQVPEAQLVYMSRNDNGYGYLLSFKLKGRDDASAITRMDLYKRETSASDWSTPIHTWADSNANQNERIVYFETDTLSYGKTYDFKLVVTDKANNTATAYVYNVTVPSQGTTYTCNQTAMGNGSFNLCAGNNKSLLHNPSNVIMTNIYQDQQTLKLRLILASVNEVSIAKGSYVDVYNTNYAYKLRIAYNEYREGSALITITALQEQNNDTDGDGLTDLREQALGTSPSQRDTDNDELSDYDEVVKWGTDPLKADTDGDRYPDGVEVRYGYNPKGPGTLF